MIRFENVTQRYRGTARPALHDVDFEVLRGEFVFLVGASGSGKSTCLRLVLREGIPSEGRVVVLGHDLRTLANRKVPYFRRHIGAVFQDFRLLPNKTVFQNVAFTLQVIGSSRAFVQQSVPEVLALVGLDGKERRLPHELSGGEQQRVAIARALVNRPQVLLADEPTGNLDPGTSVEIMQLLSRINAGGTTVVMATHEAGFVDQMQRRVIELQNGEMVRDERHGGYGDTSSLPSLAPTPERGADSVAALTAVLDLHRDLVASEGTGSRPKTRPDVRIPESPLRTTQTAAQDTAQGTDAAASVPGARLISPDKATGSIAPPAAADTTEIGPAAVEPDEALAPSPPESPARPRTAPIPIAEELELDVVELGLADRLGLGETDPDDEVGPTT